MHCLIPSTIPAQELQQDANFTHVRLVLAAVLEGLSSIQGPVTHLAALGAALHDEAQHTIASPAGQNKQSQAQDACREES
jgi:hypothetical protein